MIRTVFGSWARVWAIGCCVGLPAVSVSAQGICPDLPAGGDKGGTSAAALQLVPHGKPTRVLTVGSPGTEGNIHGFEGGSWLKVGKTYHLFTTELLGDPKEIDTGIGHWTSADQIHWKRETPLFRSTATRTGDDPRATLWAPMPIFDAKANVWDLFYIGYYSSSEPGPGWLSNYDGYVIRAVSTQPGMEGIGGPYRDVGNILRPSHESAAWEGLQGADSFYPYRVGSIWMGFYGSAHTEHRPPPSWQVGLAASKSLAGPWSRCTALNPSPIEPHFIENPIVMRIGGGYLTVYDIDHEDGESIGYATSVDGVIWSKGGRMNVGAEKGIRVRTPLGLIDNGDGTYAMLFTAREAAAPKVDGVSKPPAAVFSVYLLVVDVQRSASQTQ